MNHRSSSDDPLASSDATPSGGLASSAGPVSAGTGSAFPGSDSTMTTPNLDFTPDPLGDARAEVEPTPAEWAECEAALRSVGIDPEHGGRIALGRHSALGTRLDSGTSSAPVGADVPTDAFLARVLAIDQRRARVIGRSSRRRRFELRETLAAAGYRVDLGSRWSRGLRLAFVYGRLRLRESRALRIAGVLLFMHVLAMPVMAWVSYKRSEPEYRYHGVSAGRTLQGYTFLEEDVIQELVVEQPIEPIDREYPR